jgi:hypothetical protein
MGSASRDTTLKGTSAWQARARRRPTTRRSGAGSSSVGDARLEYATPSAAAQGSLRIDYPGVGDEESLEEIAWDECFEALENNRLAFLYQEETKKGEESRFSKLVSRNGG